MRPAKVDNAAQVFFSLFFYLALVTWFGHWVFQIKFSFRGSILLKVAKVFLFENSFWALGLKSLHLYHKKLLTVFFIINI